MDNLVWLDQFFAGLCDGEWESEYGLTIESVNNPGWMVRVDLDGTGLNPATFRAVTEQRDERNWVECKVQDGVWLGGGGLGNLDELVGIFRAWVEGRGGQTKAAMPGKFQGGPQGHQPGNLQGKQPFNKSQRDKPFRPNRRPGNRR